MPKIDAPSGSLLTVIGIDPGASGGVCVIDKYHNVVKLYKLSNSVTDVWLSIKEAYQEATHAAKGGPIRIGIEEVHAMPTVMKGKVVRGATSTFNFGLYFGYALASCVALEAPFERITPKTWQKALRMSRKESEPTNQWKGRLLERAKELYPKVDLWSQQRTKGIQLQVADALLIAHSLKLMYEGT